MTAEVLDTSGLKLDGPNAYLVGIITKGVQEINVGNETLLADETGTPVREIDKILKDKDADVPKKVRDEFVKSQKAYAAYRESVDRARNMYRTEVLGEEAKNASTLSDEEKDSLRDTRKLVMETLSFLKTLAAGNKRQDLIKWAEGIAVPQVGRQGTSVVGAKKPRVWVKKGEGDTQVVWGSFSEAAAGLSTKEKKVTAGELAASWQEQGGGAEMKFGDEVLLISEKATKKETEAAATPAAETSSE